MKMIKLVTMNYRYSLLASFLITVLFVTLPLQHYFLSKSNDKLSGRKIIKKQQSINAPKNGEAELQTFLLIDKNKNRKKRTVKWYYNKNKKENRYMIVFTKPDNIRGTTLLTWKHKNRLNDQWIYLPSLDKIRRIASSNKSGYFMGTDFTYEDLSADNMDDYTYKLLREEKCYQGECYVVEAKPVNGEVQSRTGYYKRILWVRKDIFFTVRIDYYKNKEKVIKKQKNLDITKVNNKNYRANKIMMENYSKNHKTLIKTRNRVINPDYSPQFFGKDAVIAQMPVYFEID